MRALIALIAFLFFLHFANPVFAARSLSILSDKVSLFGDEEMIITASASGFTNGETIYVKGAFYQDAASPNYFGYTKSGDSWIKNSVTTLSQRSIKIGEWDGSIISKSDFTDSGYKGEGGYKFKLGFYYLTSGGNLSAVNWSTNVLDINLNEPDPTPTPTPTTTPIPTSTPMPTPTKTPTPTPTLKPTASPTPEEVLPTDVLGESTESGSITSSANAELINNENISISGKTKNTANNLSKILMLIIGIIFTTVCGILIFLKHKKKNIWFWIKKST